MDENNQLQAPVISVGEWIVTYLLCCIPCVNIIMLFVWAFGNSNPSKKNYARATLIIVAVVLVIYAILAATVLSTFIGAANSLA